MLLLRGRTLDRWASLSEGKSCLTGSVLNGEKLKKSISDPLISSFLLLSSVAHVWPVLFNAETDMTQIPILYFDFCLGLVKYIKTKLICFGTINTDIYTAVQSVSVPFQMSSVLSYSCFYSSCFSLAQICIATAKLKRDKTVTTAQPNYLHRFVILFHVI